jgi:hypothetical protein
MMDYLKVRKLKTQFINARKVKIDENLLEQNKENQNPLV